MSDESGGGRAGEATGPAGANPPVLTLAPGGAGKPILDYAGPRQRSKFRIGSASRIEWGHTSAWNQLAGAPATGVLVREYLGQQEQAIGALVVGVGTLGFATYNLLANFRHFPRGQILILGTLLLAGLTLLPVVIQENWRRTILEWDGGRLTLAFWGPLRARRFAWTGDQVQWVRLVRTQEQSGAPLLAEIQIVASGTPPVHLFTDHPESELAGIYEALARALGIGAYAGRA